MLEAMEGEDTEPMLRAPSGAAGTASRWKRWLSALAATTLMVLGLWQRSVQGWQPAKSGELQELWAAGYKTGVKYRICNLDTKKCLTTSGVESSTVDLAPFNSAKSFFISGSRTAIVLDNSKGLCLETTSSSVMLQNCKDQVFHLPAVHMSGTIRSDDGHCLQALQEGSSIKVQPGACIGPGSSWLVGEVPEFYQSGKRYKICNTNLNVCMAICKNQEACEGSEVFLVNKSKAAEFVIRNVRGDLDVTNFALAENPDICVQAKGFGTCNGACALESHSSMVFEKCQSTRQNFFLPFPPLSYGRLRWALYQDRCITATPPDKEQVIQAQVIQCNARYPIFWQLVPSLDRKSVV